MTVSVFFTNETAVLSDYAAYTPFLSEERRLKISALKCEQDKINSLLSELLARMELSKVLSVPPDKLVFLRSELGKPYLAGFPEIHFSISHTNGAIAFACDSSPVGIDTEPLSGRHKAGIMRFFTDHEREFITKNGNSEEALLKIWTRKEAYVKMLGTGLKTPLKSFDTVSDTIPCTFATKIIGSHILSLCFSQNQPYSTKVKITSERYLLNFSQNNY